MPDRSLQPLLGIKEESAVVLHKAARFGVLLDDNDIAGPVRLARGWLTHEAEIHFIGHADMIHWYPDFEDDAQLSLFVKCRHVRRHHHQKTSGPRPLFEWNEMAIVEATDLGGEVEGKPIVFDRQNSALGSLLRPSSILNFRITTPCREQLILWIEVYSLRGSTEQQSADSAVSADSFKSETVNSDQAFGRVADNVPVTSNRLHYVCSATISPFQLSDMAGHVDLSLQTNDRESIGTIIYTISLE